MKITSFNAKGSRVCLINTDKFNTTSVCLVYRLPLDRQTVSSYALIPRVLTRATQTHPTMRSVNCFLEEAGGGELIAQTVKKGNEQILSFYMTAPKEYTGKLFELLGEILCKPLVKEDSFMPSYVHNACSVAAREIADKINDRRSWTVEKMLELMCKEEPFGICGDGYIEDFGDISGRGLYDSFLSLKKNCIREIYITGDITQSQAESYINNCLESCENNYKPREYNNQCQKHSPFFYREKADTAQSCLAMGIRAGNGSYPDLLVANEVFGGSPSSRLFTDIREKRSLCYYITSRLYRYKGIISVEAGIEAENAKTVVDFAYEQLEKINKKGADEKELTLAKDGLISGLTAIEDSPRQLMDFMLSLSVAQMDWCFEDTLKGIEQVEDIRGIFNDAFIDTVFLCEEGEK